MAVSITEYIEHTRKEIEANYYAYSFPSGVFEDMIKVSFFNGQPGHPNTGMDRVVVQFNVKYEDLQKAEEVALQLINYYDSRENYNTLLNDNEDIEIIGTMALTNAPINLGLTENFISVLLVSIEFHIQDKRNSSCGE